MHQSETKVSLENRHSGSTPASGLPTYPKWTGLGRLRNIQNGRSGCTVHFRLNRFCGKGKGAGVRSVAFGRSYTGVGTTKGGGDPVEQDFVNSEDELGERRRGGHAEPAARSYGRRPRRLRQNRREARGVGVLTCPVCGETFAKTNQLAFHDEAEHSVCDPKIATVQSFRCESCFQVFRHAQQLKHTCVRLKADSRGSTG